MIFPDKATEHSVSITKAVQADAKDIWEWRNDAQSRLMSTSTQEVSWDAHLVWFTQSLENPTRHLYVGHRCAHEKIGMCRFDMAPGDTSAQVSLNLNPAFRGQNLSSPLLQAAITRFVGARKICLRATIKKQNIASIKCFTKCGFELDDHDGTYAHYIKNCSPDAVIVLSHQMDAHGALKDESQARALKTVEVFKERSAKHIITCGWAYRDEIPISLAEAFKKCITQRLGIQEEKVLMAPDSRDTVGEAYFTKTNVVLPAAWQALCVVTSAYHVMRTREIFEFIYGDTYAIDVIGAPFEASPQMLEKEVHSLETFRKTFAGVERGNNAQILEALKTRHPYYNGQVHPKIA